MTDMDTDSRRVAGASADVAAVTPGDPRYAALNGRGFNPRYRGSPDEIRLVRTTAEVVAALQEACDSGQRPAVRSGGHCLEGFVDEPGVRFVVDTSLMTRVDHDDAMGAFVVEPGATLGDVYRRLFFGWGVVLPAGVGPSVGAGGHNLGGGFGYLNRLHGLAVDHLAAVEVVVVDRAGTARAVVATSDPADPNHDLWWAHTGGGGGNFGIVTRYWLRSPGRSPADPPAELLPRAPAAVLRFQANWTRADLDDRHLALLLRNHGAWSEAHSEPGIPEAALYSTLLLGSGEGGAVSLTGIVADDGAPQDILDAYLAVIEDGVPTPKGSQIETVTWPAFAQYPFAEMVTAGTTMPPSKMKDALLRRPLDERQVEVVLHLLRGGPPGLLGNLGLATLGGRMNAVPPAVTAMPERQAIFTMSCSSAWPDPGMEAVSLDWVRRFYADLFADADGAPAPGLYGGALINHPDRDLADPILNPSGVPWHDFYYQDNYPPLQSAKRRWDPGNVFHHALSIALD